MNQGSDPSAGLPEAVTAGVLAAVGAASDFPLDVLTMDQSLVNDLDFDSLMFTELAEHLVKIWPHLPFMDRSVIRPTTTIEDVAGWVCDTLKDSDTLKESDPVKSSAP